MTWEEFKDRKDEMIAEVRRSEKLTAADMAVTINCKE